MDVLYSGLLKDNYPFYIRRLHLKDLDNPSSLSSLSQKEYEYILADGGKMVGVFVGDRLVAFHALLVPGTDEEHLGSDVGLDSTELESVIYQEISTVSPRYRG